MTIQDISAFEKLRAVLDALPTGYPKTESGVEIKLLKKIFTEEEALMFCELKLTGETVQEIASRTGRPVAGLEDLLTGMWSKGEILRDFKEGEYLYRMVPWVVGIFEFQMNVMDKEFAQLHRELMKTLAAPLFLTKPSIMQVVPVEQNIPDRTLAMPYEQISAIIDEGKYFGVSECICKMQSRVSDHGCDKPHEVCLGISGDIEFFDKHPMKPRMISKAEAHEILKMAEDAGLIHMTANTQKDHWFLCNCCTCCCFQLIAARKGIPGTINSHYVAHINPDLCTKCNTCADTRCQVKAVDKGEKYNTVNEKKCIGCGLCVSTCPAHAIELKRKPEDEQINPPKNDMDWLRERGRIRGVDFSEFE